MGNLELSFRLARPLVSLSGALRRSVYASRRSSSVNRKTSFEALFQWSPASTPSSLITNTQRGGRRYAGLLRESSRQGFDVEKATAGAEAAEQ